MELNDLKLLREQAYINGHINGQWVDADGFSTLGD